MSLSLKLTDEEFQKRVLEIENARRVTERELASKRQFLEQLENESIESRVKEVLKVDRRAFITEISDIPLTINPVLSERDLGDLLLKLYNRGYFDSVIRKLNGNSMQRKLTPKIMGKNVDPSDFFSIDSSELEAFLDEIVDFGIKINFEEFSAEARKSLVGGTYGAAFMCPYFRKTTDIW